MYKDIKDKLKSDEYSFLKTNQHLGEKVCLLTLGGSFAYGTNTESSDVDLRGCALNSRSDILGLSNFESFVDPKTDTTVYSFNKLVGLLSACNPNTIELLGCRPESYFVLTDEGRMLIDNRHAFLSQRAAASFGGYATAQLRRLENAVARDRLPQPRKEKHILDSMERAKATFPEHYKHIPEGAMKLFTDRSERAGLEEEIFADITLSHYPVRDFKGILNELSSIASDYDKLGHRNHKKDEAHLAKHAMHLIRLYMMCIDILEKEEIVTYRPEREFLLSVRNGAFQNEDGTFRDEFFDLVGEYEKKMDYAKKNTSLPQRPDIKTIEEIVMEINERSIAMDGLKAERAEG